MKDVLIIGGGAAGLCAAIRIMQKNPQLKVSVAEQLDRVAKKLITTGNGRCNITNADCSLKHFHGKNAQFCQTALERYNNNIIEEFFKGIGVVFTYDSKGKAYPYSLQASSVVDALRFTAQKLGVEILTNTEITNITPTKQGFELLSTNGTLKARTVLVASGLYSGGAKLGSTGLVFKLLRDTLNIPTVKTTPAIVQLKTDSKLVRSLKGIKVNATVSLLCGNTLVREDFGEVLFCDYGLSGPPIMQVSREVERTNKDFKVTLDLMPEYTHEEIKDMLKRRICDLADRNTDEFFTGMLNKRVGQYIIKKCGFSLGDTVSVLSSHEDELTNAIKALDFGIMSTTGFINSQVTAGGLDTSAFYEDTLMSKKYKGLFAAGEILDIDGDCGGYNLRWAWSSGMCAANAICDYLGEN